MSETVHLRHRKFRIMAVTSWRCLASCSKAASTSLCFRIFCNSTSHLHVMFMTTPIPVLVLVTFDCLMRLRVGLVGMVQGDLKLIDVLHLRYTRFRLSQK